MKIYKEAVAVKKHKVDLIGAVKTDTGVHAIEQTANFKTERQLELEAFVKGLNGLLLEDIVIRKVEEVDLDFNTRYNAKSRVHHYRIYLGRTAILRRYVWEVLYALNLDTVFQTTNKIKGEHYFSLI